MSRPILTSLYVPGDEPTRVGKALSTNADVVIIDWEDAVAPARKEQARDQTLRLLTDTRRAVQVRINHHRTPWHSEDLRAIRMLPLDIAVRVPKVESADEVETLASALPGRRLNVLIESAIGVERAFQIATASAPVATLGLGESDLRSDLRVSGDAGLAWSRGRVVNAARAAGLPRPQMSIFPNVLDTEGLEASCRAGKAIGFLGRAAIHPRQLDTIRRAFEPTTEEVRRAREVLGNVEAAQAAGRGAVRLEDGSFLDLAFVEEARAVIGLAASWRESPE